MFFIFGIGHKTVNNHGEVIPVICPNCQNRVYYSLLESTEWFTLFFIPVIPYDTKNILFCPICSAGIELSNEKKEIAKNYIILTKKSFNNEITKEEYLKKLKSAYKKLFTTNIENQHE